MRISDWSSDVCSSDLPAALPRSQQGAGWPASGDTMIHNFRMRTLLGGCALLALAGCGADDVASPGEGVIVVPTPTPSPTPSPTPTPTPTPGGPAADGSERRPVGSAGVSTGRSRWS